MLRRLSSMHASSSGGTAHVQAPWRWGRPSRREALTTCPSRMLILIQCHVGYQADERLEESSGTF